MAQPDAGHNSISVRPTVTTCCFKCKDPAAFTPSRDGKLRPYCRRCFAAYVETGARDGFCRLCGVPTDVPVCLAVSGGASSLAMLHVAAALRRENLARGGAGRIEYNFFVLHIDEVEHAANDSEEEAAPTAASSVVKAAADQGGLPCYVLPLSQLVDASALAAARTGPAALTDREDAFHMLRRSAIYNAAVALGAHAVVSGESATTCAWRSLGEVVRGRGESVRDFYGYHGLVRVGPRRDLLLFRPMRTLLAKETALYARLNGMASTYLPTPATGTSLRSLDRVLENFIAGLEVGYKSTVFNVLNAVDRCGPMPDRGDSSKRGASGVRGLKQHLHQIIAAVLRRRPESRTAGDHSTADSENGSSAGLTCGGCSATLPKASRDEAVAVAADAGAPACRSRLCHGCRRSEAAFHAAASPQRATFGEVAGDAIGGVDAANLVAALLRGDGAA